MHKISNQSLSLPCKLILSFFLHLGPLLSFFWIIGSSVFAHEHDLRTNIFALCGSAKKFADAAHIDVNTFPINQSIPRQTLARVYP